MQGECKMTANKTKWMDFTPFYRVPQASVVLFVDGIGEYICTGCRFDPFNKENVKVGQLETINDIYEAL